MCGLCSQIGLNSDLTLHDILFQNKTLFRLSILQKAISNQVQYAMYIPSYPQQDCFHYGFYQFKGLHQFRICGTPLHVQPAPLTLDLNPIHPAFSTSIPFHPTRMTSQHWSAEFLQIFPQPHLFARLASLCPAPGCFTGWCVRCVHGFEIVWVEIPWVQRLKFFGFQLTPLHMKQTR